MDVPGGQIGKSTGYDSGMPPGYDLKQIIFTNLQLLGFDGTAMEIKYKIPFNKEMFNLPNKAGGEAVLHFLFNTLNPTLSRQEFRDCWPIIDKKSESTFRKICCIWLQNIQKEDAESRLPRINASLFLSPGGEKFYQLLFAFSTYVLLHVFRTEYCSKDNFVLGFPALTAQNKDLGDVMETSCTCAAVKHRKHFLDTLGQTAEVKRSWQSYSDEMAKAVRMLSAEIREVERSKRDQVKEAAQRGDKRGSPLPASRQMHDMSMSAHTASRAQRVQQIRSLWKGVDAYIHNSQEERNIVTSIIDRTLQKYVIDAADIKISVPHLMLSECEEEIKQRQVENVFDGGQLNLVSVLQLWNLALRMYTHRLNAKGLRDVSHESGQMRTQAHSHQAYLANTKTLRERMAKEVPQRKKTVEALRKHFTDLEMKRYSPGMIAPSPPVTFEPARGHTGATPTGPVLQKTPDLAKTPEAAIDIADLISQSSRRQPVAPFQTTAFGVTDAQNWNRNNSNASRLPQPSSSSSKSSSRSTVTVTQSSNTAARQGRSTVQPRVVRHVGRQTTSTIGVLKKDTKTAGTKTASTKTTSSAAPQKQQLSSTPEKAPRKQAHRPAHNPAPTDANNSATQSPRERARDILADKIVWSVMNDDGESGVGHDGLESLSSQAGLFPGVPVTPASGRFTTPHGAPTPVQRSLAGKSGQKLVPTTLHFAQSASKREAEHSESEDENWSRSKVKMSAQGSKHVPHSDRDQTVFDGARSPVTLVQREDWAEGVRGATSGRQTTTRFGAGSAFRGGPLDSDEEDDASVQNPVAAFGEEAFVSHDRIDRSPLTPHIKRMWQETISGSPGNSDAIPSRVQVTDWLDSDHENSGDESGETPTPTSPHSSASLSHTCDTAESSPTHAARDLIPQAGDLSEQVADLQLDGSPGQIKDNDSMGILTHFEDDEFAEDVAADAERSAAEWKEHMSVLYGEDDVEDNTETLKPAADFESTLDEMFQSRSPRGNKRTDAVLGQSPLISFTPQTSSFTNSPKPGRTQSRQATEETSDKENHGSPELEQTAPHKLYDNGQVLQSQSPPKMPLAKKVTFSPDNSLHSYVRQTPDMQDQDTSGNDDDDLIDVSSASPLNESFTPVRTGLFVQGKLDGRADGGRSNSNQTKSSQSFVGKSNLQGGGNSTRTSASAPASMLDKDLATQLSRLRKMTAEVFGQEAGSSPLSGGTEWEDSASAGGMSSPPTRSRPDTVGGELDELEPIDIFGEDDTVLLPASP